MIGSSLSFKEGMANHVYGGRMGNGGEGYKYRGRGIFQLTGKNNYTAFNAFVNVSGKNFVSNPELILETEYSILSAMWFFKVNVVDKISIGDATVKKVSAYINNGGDEGAQINGLTDRTKLYNKAIEKLK